MGSCNTPKPGALDFVGKAKWNAWNELGNTTQVCSMKYEQVKFSSLAIEVVCSLPVTKQ